MWRTVFLAFGISLCILGGECLICDKVILAQPVSSSPLDPYDGYTDYQPLDYSASPYKRTVVPPEWAPWALFALGVVTILYSSTRGDSSGE